MAPRAALGAGLSSDSCRASERLSVLPSWLFCSILVPPSPFSFPAPLSNLLLLSETLQFL